MSMGGALEVGSVVLEVRRRRWRYVKGGLRMVILFCAGVDLVPDGAVWDVGVSAETAAIFLEDDWWAFNHFSRNLSVIVGG